MKRAPDDNALARLNRDFADLVRTGRIERIHITPAEVRDDDAPTLARLALTPRPNFPRLRQLIDTLNAV
jgi:hypothetical protein